MPPEGLESSVDGLGRPVRAVGVVEEREDVRHAAFEGASERDESGASGRRSPDSEGFDELGHHAPSLPTVLLRVTGDDLLVDAVREGERLVGRVAKQLVGAFLLSVGPETGGLEQDPPALVERPWCRAVPSVRAGAGSAPRKPATHGPQGPALPFMAARGTAAPARAPPLDRAGGELNRWVFRASHSRIPEIVELSKKKSGDAAPTSHAPSNRATPAPGSRPSTTGSRPPSA